MIEDFVCGKCAHNLLCMSTNVDYSISRAHCPSCNHVILMFDNVMFLRVPDKCPAFYRGGGAVPHGMTSSRSWDDYVKDMERVALYRGLTKAMIYEKYYLENARLRFCDVCAPGEVAKLKKRLEELCAETHRLRGVT